MRHLIAKCQLVAVVAAMVLAAACSDDGPAAPPATTSTPAPTTTLATTTSVAPGTTQPGETTAVPPGTSAASTTTSPPPSADPNSVANTPVALQKIATASSPLVLATRAGTDALYVAERAGRVRVLTGTSLGPAILDFSSDVTTNSEKGFLGMAFSPDGARLYTSFTNADSNSQIDEYTMSADAVDEASRRKVLEVEQPAGNHNGGYIGFGPDGYLWFGLGDGGGSGDRYGNGQNLDTLLGSMLRIDPTGRSAGGYAVPADNPWADGGGRPETWIYGLRNPWRWSFDRITGDLWIGDVGEGAIEEIDRLPFPELGRGANLQWPLREGTRQYSGAAPAGSVGPVFEYGRTNGECSVTGGFVYRGAALPGLTGAYIYGDFCEGSLFALVPKGDGYERIGLGVNAGRSQLVSFGEDNVGELYVIAIGGAISKLVPA